MSTVLASPVAPTPSTTVTCVAVVVHYRHAEDTVPDPGSLPSAFPGRGVPVREPNVLVDDYWDLYTALLR